MGYFFMILGFFVVIGGLIKIVIDLFKKVSIKKSGIILLTGFIMFVVGLIIVPKDTDSSSKSDQSSKVEKKSVAASKQRKAGKNQQKEKAISAQQTQRLVSMAYAGYNGQKFFDALKKAGVKNIDPSKINYAHDETGASYTYPYDKEGREYSIFVKPDGGVQPFNDPGFQKKAKEFATDNSSYVESAAKRIFEENGYKFNGHVILGGTNGGYSSSTQLYETDFLDAEVSQGNTNYKHQKVTVLYTVPNNKIDNSKPNGGIEVKKITMNGTTIYG